MSLAHLWQRQGKRTEAYELLAPIYTWFTAGFDTADLKAHVARLKETRLPEVLSETVRFSAHVQVSEGDYT